MLAVQTAHNNAVTELSSEFLSMTSSEGFQYGCNENGVYLLNQANHNFESSFTLATTDIGDHHPKRLRYLYVGIDTDNTFTVSVKVDRGEWRDYSTEPLTTGLQRIKVPIGKSQQGRYFTIKISSNYIFRIDSIKGLFSPRSTGIRGY